LSKGYLRNLLQYLSSVYNIGEKIKKLSDNITNPKITTSAIAFALLIDFILKIRSFNQLDDWLEHNDFKRIAPQKMRFPRIDAIRDSLKVIEIKGIEALHHSIIRTSIQNKLVRNGTIDVYKVVAFDGVELFESTKKNCDNCLTRVIKNVPHYFHRSIVGAYVGVIHDKNGLEATLMFLIIYFNLMQLFFFRRMNNFRSRKLLQVEVLERMTKEMVAYDARGEYLIDTG